MSLTPEFTTFEKEYKSGRNQVVYSKLTSDLDTPVSIMLKLAGAKKNSFILESVTGGEIRGRYSIIGMDPDLIWKFEEEQSFLSSGDSVFKPISGQPLSVFRDLLQQSVINLPKELPQSSAGLFGYFGYDMVRHVENLPNLNKDTIGLPDAMFIRPSIIAVLDGVKGEVILVAPVFYEPKVDEKEAFKKAKEKISSAIRELKKQAIAERNLGAPGEMEEPTSNFTKEEYKAAVNIAKNYINNGDIFQVVLSQRFETKLTKSPIEIYKKLRISNPSPFMYFFNFSDFQIIGASPEILVRLRNNKITIRPIAGTRPRGDNLKKDKFYEKDLLADKKELAEHLMLLDLGRNDAGKVSKINSVKVTESFKIEKYSHVMHIVSNVEGVFNNKYSKFDTLLSGFPAGTVSGAPKIRAMEIIDELETTRRKVYAGGIGYFSANGDFDTCIALRTAIAKNNKFYVQSGAGIVADSKPLNEYFETVNKAKALLKSLE